MALKPLEMAYKISNNYSTKFIVRAFSTNLDSIPVPEKQPAQNQEEQAEGRKSAKQLKSEAAKRHHEHSLAENQAQQAKLSVPFVAEMTHKPIRRAPKTPMMMSQLLAKSRERNVLPPKAPNVQVPGDEDISMRNLQPSRLPKFLNSLDTHALNVSKSSVGNNYPSFSESKTVSACTLPLKASRLANAFPEPVKLLPSRKVSDQEKADQMFAESRGMGGGNCATGTSRKFSTFAKAFA